MKKLFLALALLVVLSTASFGHEGHGFKHMGPEGSGPIIGQSFCDVGVQIWWVDYDGDRKIDVCKHVLFMHDIIHVKEVAPINGKCECSE